METFEDEAGLWEVKRLVEGIMTFVEPAKKKAAPKKKAAKKAKK